MKKLNLGCGAAWKDYPDYDGLDIIDYGQKYVGDISWQLGSKSNTTPGPTEYYIPSEFFDGVMAYHFLEHFDQDQLKFIFQNVYRILKVGASFKIMVPHMKKEQAWVLMHKTFWNEFTFRWLERSDADGVYGFGKWKIKELVVNSRDDIYCELIRL